MLGKLIGGLFGLGGAKAPPPPSAPAVQPQPNDAAILAAKTKQQQAIEARSGRASTILTDMGANPGSTDKLG